MPINKMSIFIFLIMVLSACNNTEQVQLVVPEIPVFQTRTKAVPVYQNFVGRIYGLK